MKHYLTLLVLSLPVCITASAQRPPDTIPHNEPVIPMMEVRVKAFEQSRKLRDVPAAVGYVSRAAMERFSPASIVSAVNTLPGVRMEERSPGSYRFNIRGSSLRSPFGVRNVKVYYNDIPMTDPGGTTYLNQLGYYSFQSVEVVKGPGSSLYGAGTGGVLMIENLSEQEQAGASAAYTAGSYGLQQLHASVSTGSEKMVSRLSYQHQQSDGYRTHSELKRDVYSWTGIFRMSEKKYLKTSFLYGDLFYETPGALTKAEYTANPRGARPGAGGFPGAEAAKASIRQRSFIAGASYVQQFAPHWENKSVLYGMFTELRNPTVRNYEKNSLPHVGGRTVFNYKRDIGAALLAFSAGGEWQEGFSTVSVHRNINGSADSLQSMDETTNRQQFIFAQASVDVKNWVILAGASWNTMRIRFQRFQPRTAGLQKRKFDNELAPRFALMRKLEFGNFSFNIYSSVSKGFSPPSTAELLPTGGAINLQLEAEEGTNYDLGVKGTFRELYFDVNAFVFSLSNTIVQRRDAGGGDYFLNAGKTQQRGVETYVSYPLLKHSFSESLFWVSHTWHRFKYKEFRQLNNDFSGKQLPASAPHTVSSGMDVQLRNGVIAGVNYYYSDRLPLNDLNSEYASAYHLLGLRIGYGKTIRQVLRCRLTAGAENLLDQKYSLGNDINGFGGRYYNAAAGRNYFVSLQLQWMSKGMK